MTLGAISGIIQQRGKNGDDGDNDKQFDKGEFFHCASKLADCD